METCIRSGLTSGRVGEGRKNWGIGSVVEEKLRAGEGKSPEADGQRGLPLRRALLTHWMVILP